MRTNTCAWEKTEEEQYTVGAFPRYWSRKPHFHNRCPHHPKKRKHLTSIACTTTISLPKNIAPTHISCSTHIPFLMGRSLFLTTLKSGLVSGSSAQHSASTTLTQSKHVSSMWIGGLPIQIDSELGMTASYRDEGGKHLLMFPQIRISQSFNAALWYLDLRSLMNG